MKKLNLGCGEFKKQGFVNVDWIGNPDIKHNLNKYPYPFKKREFKLIVADHLLEHLDNPFKFMKECHRILDYGGKLVIRVPHFSRGFSHPEHKIGFDVSFPLYFNPFFLGGYSGIPFKIQQIKLTWFAQKYLKKETLNKFQYYSGCIFDFIFSALANLSPYFCSRCWCYIVGGFEEIKFVFKR